MTGDLFVQEVLHICCGFFDAEKFRVAAGKIIILMIDQYQADIHFDTFSLY
jgi:hypothetical protein